MISHGTNHHPEWVGFNQVVPMISGITVEYCRQVQLTMLGGNESLHHRTTVSNSATIQLSAMLESSEFVQMLVGSFLVYLLLCSVCM